MNQINQYRLSQNDWTVLVIKQNWSNLLSTGIGLVHLDEQNWISYYNIETKISEYQNIETKWNRDSNIET